MLVCRGSRSHSDGGARQGNVTRDDVTGFDAERPRLTAIATRILGSEADADDVVQEAWLRLSRTDDVDDLPAWLTTVVTRLCLDHLRKRRTRSEAEAEAPADPAPVDPEADALLAERMGGAMQVVLDTLAPAERVAFVLHDVFGYPSTRSAPSWVARVPPYASWRAGHGARCRACRSRSRRRPRAPRAAASSTRSSPQPAAGISRPCCRCSRPTLSCVPTWSDRRWARDPVYDGAAAVAARFNGARGAAPVTIDGELGAAWIHAGAVKVAFVFHVEAGLVREIELIADPDVLATMDVVRARGKS